jgi:glycosyltransferase involved in cell wall biosynthesis
MGEMIDANSNNKSVITTVYNESKSILGFLDSYLRQTAYADEFVIVDGGSTDETAALILDFSKAHQHLGIKLVVDSTCCKKFSKGPIARGRNVAIAAARNEIIAVCDAGCLLDSKWLEEITKPFQDREVDVVSGWYEPVLDSPFREAYARLFLPKLESVDRENFLPSSRSIAFRKKAWAKVGGYPEGTYTAEDTKYDMLLKSSGCRFYFAERAVAYWQCPANLDEAMKKHYTYGYGDGQHRLFKTTYAKILFSLLLPYKYLFFPKYRNVGRMAWFVNLALAKGYLKGLLEGEQS